MELTTIGAGYSSNPIQYITEVHNRATVDKSRKYYLTLTKQADKTGHWHPLQSVTSSFVIIMGDGCMTKLIVSVWLHGGLSLLLMQQRHLWRGIVDGIGCAGQADLTVSVSALTEQLVTWISAHELCCTKQPLTGYRSGRRTEEVSWDTRHLRVETRVVSLAHCQRFRQWEGDCIVSTCYWTNWHCRCQCSQMVRGK